MDHPASTSGSIPRNPVCFYINLSALNKHFTAVELIHNELESCLIWLNITFLNLLAPDRPPKITGIKIKGQFVNVGWEHVVPLSNESLIETYRVSELSALSFLGSKTFF